MALHTGATGGPFIDGHDHFVPGFCFGAGADLQINIGQEDIVRDDPGVLRADEEGAGNLLIPAFEDFDDTGFQMHFPRLRHPFGLVALGFDMLPPRWGIGGGDFHADPVAIQSRIQMFFRDGDPRVRVCPQHGVDGGVVRITLLRPE